MSPHNFDSTSQVSKADGFNRNLQVTPKASPKEATLSSVNSDIKSNNLNRLGGQRMELTKEYKEQIAWEMALSDFFNKNYAMLLATFLEDNHDKFMEHVEDKYEDHKGKEMKWKWVD